MTWVWVAIGITFVLLVLLAVAVLGWLFELESRIGGVKGDVIDLRNLHSPPLSLCEECGAPNIQHESDCSRIQS